MRNPRGVLPQPTPQSWDRKRMFFTKTEKKVILLEIPHFGC
jgi:hypothetical protein